MNRDPRRLRIVLAVLVLAAFTLVTLDYRAGNSGPFSSVRRGVNDVFAPVGTGLSSAFRPVGHFFADVGHAGRDGARVRSLQHQVAALQAQLRQQGDVAAQQAQLRQLLSFSAAQRLKILPAQVVGIGDASGFDDSVTLNVGTADGVQRDMTVIAGTTQGGGLVGRVVAVSTHNATVATVIDPDVHVGARLRRAAPGAGTQAGLANGHGLAPLTFTPADPAVRPVKGDIVQTYGSLTYAAAGIPIGRVTSIGPTPGKTGVTASVVPFFDYDGLDVVGVVFAPAPTARATPVLPTVTVRATVTVTAPPATSGAAAAPHTPATSRSR